MIIYIITAIVGLIVGFLIAVRVIDAMIEREKEEKYGLPRGYFRTHRKD